MKRDQIGLQTYTLRELCQDQAGFIETCRQVAEIGYKVVEIAGINRDEIKDESIGSICADHGLTICAVHDDPVEILQNPGSIVKKMQKIGCDSIAYPVPHGYDLSSETAVKELINDLNNAGRVYAGEGMKFLYHNHQREFRKINNRTILDLIYEGVDEAYLQAEIDVYWIQYGGENPADWCRKVSGRLPIVHLKDFMINENNAIGDAPVGDGNLNIPEIIRAGDEAECGWYIVEQDAAGSNPMEAVARSYSYLQSLIED